jgi:hypothetical protein
MKNQGVTANRRNPIFSLGTIWGPLEKNQPLAAALISEVLAYVGAFINSITSLKR